VSRKDVRIYDAIRHRLRSSRGKLSSEKAGANTTASIAAGGEQLRKVVVADAGLSGSGLITGGVDVDMETVSRDYGDVTQSGSLFEGSVHGLGAGSRAVHK
jgi:hypothetical protein